MGELSWKWLRETSKRPVLDSKTEADEEKNN